MRQKRFVYKPKNGLIIVNPNNSPSKHANNLIVARLRIRASGSAGSR
jgi:hypothetical protein